jgi:hypothetical protein
MRVFIGPTGVGMQFPDGVEVYPPAQQGDIATAVLEGVKSILLVDGLFTQHLAPWHKEILFALDAGVRVGGAGSLGALRGVECERYGMEVYGKIADWYKSGDCTDDSDVALTHLEASDNFEPCSVPLVNIRATCLALEAKGAIASAEKVIAECAAIYYPNRNWSALKALVPEHQLIRDWYIDQKQIDAQEAASAMLGFELASTHREKPKNSLNYLLKSLLENDTFSCGRRKWESALLKDEAFNFWMLTELAMAAGVVASEEQIFEQSVKMWKALGIFESSIASEWMAENGVSDLEWNRFAIRKAIRQNAFDWFNSVSCGSEIAPLTLQFQTLNNIQSKKQLS